MLSCKLLFGIISLLIFYDLKFSLVFAFPALTKTTTYIICYSYSWDHVALGPLLYSTLLYSSV